MLIIVKGKLHPETLNVYKLKYMLSVWQIWR